MRKRNRLLALFITCVLLFSSFSFAVSAVPATAPPTPTRVGEVDTLREVNSETYLMSDGSYECVVYSYDKYYKAADKTLQLVDNKIVPAKASEHSKKITSNKTQYKNAANAFDVHFSTSGTPEISVAYQDNSITFSPVALSGSTSRDATNFSVGKVNILNNLTYTGDNTVTYSNAFPNADLVYVLENNILKEYIILNNTNAANTFEFVFCLEGVTLRSMDKYADFVDQNGKTLFTLDSLFAVDASGTFTEALTYSFTPVKGTNNVMVTITLDNTYLSDADRVFPVVIDPSIMISSVETADACVCSYTPNTNYQGAYQLRTGMDTDYGVRRSYIKFNIPNSIPAGSITNSNLHIETLSGASPLIVAYRCTGSWSSGSITWNNKPGFSTTDDSTLSSLDNIGSTWYTMDVSNIVQSWVNGTYANYGFVLKDLNESDSDHWTTLYSSDAPSPHKPELYISYVTESENLSISSTTSGYISAGFINKYSFTPSKSTKYSIWTTGTTNTTISVYNNSALTTRIGYADGGGHYPNACVSLNLIAGTTYYIIIGGGTLSTSGIYAINLYEGLPMSGSERLSFIEIFNNSTYVTRNNCYTYALGVWKNPITGSLFEGRGTNPGALSGMYFNPECLIDAETAKAEITRLVKADCVAWGGSASDFYEVSSTAMVPEGFYKIALAIDPGTTVYDADYHWYRQVSDLNGAWTHKIGGNLATTTDATGASIFSPQEAARDDYTVFVGYFAIKPPSLDKLLIINNSSQQNSTYSSKEIPHDDKITLAQFSSFSVGSTTKEQVLLSVGSAHTTHGSGLISDVYYTTDGYCVYIYYSNGVIAEAVVCCVENDTTFINRSGKIQYIES